MEAHRASKRGSDIEMFDWNDFETVGTSTTPNPRIQKLDDRAVIKTQVFPVAPRLRAGLNIRWRVARQDESNMRRLPGASHAYDMALFSSDIERGTAGRYDAACEARRQNFRGFTAYDCG